MYCLVHFYRGLYRKFRFSPHYQAMRSLPEITSRSECQRVLNDLCSCENKSVRDWAQHKSYNWILCGYNRKFTRIDPIVWEQTCPNTNPSEIIHAATYEGGKQLPLMVAYQR
jgi:hypothetical protein